MKNKFAIIALCGIMLITALAGIAIISANAYQHVDMTKFHVTATSLTYTTQTTSVPCGQVSFNFQVVWERIYSSYWGSYSTDDGYVNSYADNYLIVSYPNTKSTGTYNQNTDSAAVYTYGTDSQHANIKVALYITWDSFDYLHNCASPHSINPTFQPETVTYGSTFTVDWSAGGGTGNVGFTAYWA